MGSRPGDPQSDGSSLADRTRLEALEAEVAGLRRSEAQYREIVENSTELIACLDAQHRLRFVNQAYCRFWGRSAEQLRGLDPRDLVPEEERQRITQDFALLTPQEPLLMRELYAIGAVGHECWHQWVIQAHFSPDGQFQGLTVWGRDISEQKRAEAVLELRVRLAALSAEMGSALTHHSLLSEGLAQCAAAAVEQLSLALVRIWTYHESSQRLELQASAGPWSLLDQGQKLPLGQALVEQVLDRREVAFQHASAKELLQAHRIDSQPPGISIAGFPLVVGGRLVGVLTVFSCEPLLPLVLEWLGQISDKMALGIDRKAQEEALRPYRLIAESSRDIVLFVRRRDGRILEANLAAEKAYGCSRQELLNQTIYQLRASDLPVTIRQHMDRADQDGVLFETFHRRRDGSLFPVEVSSRGETVANERVLLSIIRDVSERYRDGEQLRRLAAAVEQASEGMAILDPFGGILYINPAFARITGYRSEEVCGHNITSLYRSAESVQVCEELTAQLTTGQGWAGRLTNRRKDGTLYHEEITLSPVRDNSGRLVNFVLVQRDITKEVQHEEHLRQSSKMEAIGQLAGGVAHDFNNILTTILGNAEMLIADYTFDPSLGQGLKEIRVAAERAASLTRQLLAFSRRQVLRPQVLDLNTLIRNLEKMLRRLIGEDIELELELDAQAAAVEIDPGQLDQILLNLVVNARDAMPQGGRLVVRTSVCSLSELELGQYSGLQAGLYDVLEVCDTGLGMDLATRERIFDPFFTTKEVGKGTGLGLSTIYGIVQQSGGHIRVQSQLGVGTTFTILLPAVLHKAHSLEAGSQQEVSLCGEETVLLVEDSEDTRKLVHRMLRKYGYVVLEASNSQDALALAQAHPGPIHLLLTDVVMPGTSGRELAYQLLMSRPETAVLYMTGYTDDAMLRHGVLRSGMTVLDKPFTSEQLARRIRALLDSFRTAEFKSA